MKITIATTQWRQMWLYKNVQNKQGCQNGVERYDQELQEVGKNQPKNSLTYCVLWVWIHCYKRVIMHKQHIPVKLFNARLNALFLTFIC